MTREACLFGPPAGSGRHGPRLGRAWTGTAGGRAAFPSPPADMTRMTLGGASRVGSGQAGLGPGPYSESGVLKSLRGVAESRAPDYGRPGIVTVRFDPTLRSHCVPV
jgi:hypothetical protein